MGSSKLTSLDPFLNTCSDIDFLVNENPSQVDFTCPKLVNPEESRPVESDSDWEEEDTHDDGNAFDICKD